MIHHQQIREKFGKVLIYDRIQLNSWNISNCLATEAPIVAETVVTLEEVTEEPPAEVTEASEVADVAEVANVTEVADVTEEDTITTTQSPPVEPVETTAADAAIGRVYRVSGECLYFHQLWRHLFAVLQYWAVILNFFFSFDLYFSVLFQEQTCS